MKEWIIRDVTKPYYNLAIIKANSNIEALKTFQERNPNYLSNGIIKPFRGTQAIFFGYNGIIEAWEHTSLF